MLIDASHQEETRVAIVDGNQVQEFDYESSAKKQLKGSIYLAKVTRVEPSLQAAFVDYGGNRHGFLAFSEIHPDYYQIPVADREALIAAEAKANADLLNDDDVKAQTTKDDPVVSDDENADDESADDESTDDESGAQKDNEQEKSTEDEEVEEVEENDENGFSDEEDEEEKLRIKMAKRLRYKYKIQEVIKKNQIILIQVVKEERGNKGAALTTYLSLPGRYCVLMPNTLHGGGVSRKIANVKDRKKLKNILSSLNMPKGHACIIRTAGSDRTTPEINRDYDYLKRMWEAIRELTLKSIAPSLVYEEGNLIKRSIRDLYTRDITEILVEGLRGYNTAKNFMQLLMPTHASKIVEYKDPIPLFQHYQVESHLDSMYSPNVQLKSGGYIVINPTEALVSIDVNSGRATKEHNIEETAIKTNLEAAEEVARQLKLRDMAGLIVIDFIDMEDQRNNRSVERKMKLFLKGDRARIQVGRISSFGLMEMSRQRLRVGVLESSTTACPHCEGSGLLRSVESQSLHILRVIEEEATSATNSQVTVYLPSTVAIYILNNKRNNLVDLEKRYDFSVSIAIDNDLTASAHKMEKSGSPSKASLERKDALKLGNTLIDVSEEDVSPEPVNNNASENQDRPKRRRRRRRNQYNKNSEENTQQRDATDQPSTDQPEKSDNDNDKDKDQKSQNDLENKERPRRSRPRRNRNRIQDNDHSKAESTEVANDVQIDDKQSEIAPTEEKPKRAPRKPRVKASDKIAEIKTTDDVQDAAPQKEDKPKPVRKRKSVKKDDVKKDSAEKEAVVDIKPAAELEKKPRKKAVKKPAPEKDIPLKTEEKPKADAPKKKGWWSRATS